MRFLAMLLTLTSVSAFSADIVFFRGSPEKLLGYVGMIPDTWRPRIVLAGDIVPGDDKRFSVVLKQARDQSKDWETDGTLRLDSEGGDVATAMSIGRLVRKAQLTTIVQENNTCASACVLILAGGVWRIAWGDGRIGLHRPYFVNPVKAVERGYENFQQAYDSALEVHRVYFTEMRIGAGLLERMVQIPSNDVHWIDHATASRLNLLGEDATYAEWELAQRIAKRGRTCVEWEHRQGACLGRLGFPADGVYERCVEITRKPVECQ
jgi:hypothetical protein